MQHIRSLIGRRIREARQKSGLSRSDVARRFGIDISAIAAWETGRNLPRDSRRATLSRLLGIDEAALFSETPEQASDAVDAKLVSTLPQLPEALLDALNRTQRCIKAVHPAVPHRLFWAHATEFRQQLCKRLLERSIEVQRVEFFYDLTRLKEVLSNIFRYDGCAYIVKGLLVGDRDDTPTIAAHFFDDEEFIFGAYWASVGANEQPCLRCRGKPFRAFFRSFWNEVWHRGAVLNIDGARDLMGVRAYALRLGLNPEDWPQFVSEAREYEIGDGAPPPI